MIPEDDCHCYHLEGSQLFDINDMIHLEMEKRAVNLESRQVQRSENNKNGSKLSVDTRCCVIQQVRICFEIKHVNIVKRAECMKLYTIIAFV